MPDPYPLEPWRVPGYLDARGGRLTIDGIDAVALAETFRSPLVVFSEARILRNARAIRAAFEAIFANGTIAVRAEKVHRVRSLDASVHSVIEQVTLRAQGQEQSGWVMATNAYIKTAQGWRMVAHHASPGTRDEPVEIVEAPSVLH